MANSYSKDGSISVKLFGNELDVEEFSLTPYLEQGSDTFQLSGDQSRFCKEGVLMFYLVIDIGKRTHVASRHDPIFKAFYDKKRRKENNISQRLVLFQESYAILFMQF